MKIIALQILFLMTFTSCSIDRNVKSNLPKTLEEKLRSSKSFNDVFQFKDSIIFTEHNPLIVNDVRSIFYSKDSLLVIADYKSGIFFIDKKGVIINIIQKYGDGPGEFNSISSLVQDAKGYYYLFDSARLIINIYDSNFNFIRNYYLKSGGLKKIVVDLHGNVITLHESAFNKFKPAITKYDPYGNFVGEFGEIPKTAILQEFLLGGGICADENDNIYYGFLSDHRIFKVSSNFEEENTFSNKPNYFREAKESDMDLEDQLKLIEYSWRISRINGIYFQKPGFLVQQISNGNPREGEKVKQYIELWDLNGNKLNSGLLSPDIITGSDGSHLFFISQNYNNNTKNISTKIIVFKTKW